MTSPSYLRAHAARAHSSENLHAAICSTRRCRTCTRARALIRYCTDLSARPYYCVLGETERTLALGAYIRERDTFTLDTSCSLSTKPNPIDSKETTAAAAAAAARLYSLLPLSEATSATPPPRQTLPVPLIFWTKSTRWPPEAASGETQIEVSSCERGGGEPKNQSQHARAPIVSSTEVTHLVSGQDGRSEPAGHELEPAAVSLGDVQDDGASGVACRERGTSVQSGGARARAERKQNEARHDVPYEQRPCRMTPD